MRHGPDLVARSPTRGWVRSVARTDDGDVTLSVATDQTLRLWDARTGDELRSLPLTERLWTVHTAGAKAVTAGADGHPCVYTVSRMTTAPDQVLSAPQRLWAALPASNGETGVG